MLLESRRFFFLFSFEKGEGKVFVDWSLPRRNRMAKAAGEISAELLLPPETLIPTPFRSSFSSLSSRIACSRSFKVSCKPLLSALPSRGVPIASASAGSAQRSMVEAFHPMIPLAEAVTPPSSWYTDPSFLALEFERVFFRGWQAVGYTEQVQKPHDFFTGRLGNVEYIICRDDNGDLHAFHNVCRHHASILVSGSGQKSCFQCPYHGWTYGLDGNLLKATRISGIRNFNKDEFSLIQFSVTTWGPFVLICLDKDALSQQSNSYIKMAEDEWLGSASSLLKSGGVDSSLKHLCRREYTIKCNWKVFCDNYLDGGYHVPYAHGGLSSGLELDSYSTEVFEKVSIQSCKCDSSDQEDFDRLGSETLYAFVYPNFMINRYGPWMDTNLVLPLGPNTCQVIFDYFLDASFVGDEVFIRRSLEDSERVQMEDIVLCEGVQRGLESPAYSTGRYAPSVEKAMHHFHCLLHQSLNDA